MSFVRTTFQACFLSLTAVHVTQIKVQQKRAEADPVAPYSRSFNRTLVGTLYAASGGLGLVSHLTPILHLHCMPVACFADLSHSTCLMSLTPSSECQVDRQVRVGGWVKTGREAGGGAFAFLEVNDGSCLTNLQVRIFYLCT